jgi:hypothetical protein
VQLRALRQDLRKFFESVDQKIRFAMVMTGQRMSSLDDPINVVRNVSKKFTSVAGFKAFKNIANLRKSYGHWNLLSGPFTIILRS